MGNIGTGSGTSYPVSLDTQSAQEVDSPSASKTRLRAAVPNDLIVCTLAIENSIGTTPQGTKADVKTFLQMQHAATGTHTGYATTQLNATASRMINRNFAMGSIYQNISTRPMYISVYVFGPTTFTLKLFADSNSTPSTIISYCKMDGSTVSPCVFGIVMPSHYYAVQSTFPFDVSPDGWFEWT